VTRYNADKHNRQSIRLKGYDYTRPGAYFVTIVTHQRAPVFDDPVFRRVAETMWQRIPRHFSHVELDAWVVMPNHVHGIIVIVDEPPGRGKADGRGKASGGSCPVENVVAHGQPPHGTNRAHADASPLPQPNPCGPPSGSLGAIVGNFKSVTTRRINRIRRTPGARVWQRNYHDRVIRGERGLITVRRYIEENPIRWACDRNNPDR
jgi:putative transposase